MNDAIKTIYQSMLTRESSDTSQELQAYVIDTIELYHKVLSSDYDIITNTQNLLNAIIEDHEAK